MFRRFSTCVNGAVCSVRVGGRHVLLEQSRAQQPQPFRSTALDFDCDSQFKSDTDCTRTNDAALFAYAVVNGTWGAVRDCPEGLTLAGVVCSLALNEVKYVRTVTVTTIYACYITIDLSRRHCHVPFFFFFFKGLAQLALCHVLDQKLYDIGWFSHRRRNSTCGRRSLNTGANVSSSAVGSTLCSSLPFPSLLLSSLLFRPISLC